MLCCNFLRVRNLRTIMKSIQLKVLIVFLFFCFQAWSLKVRPPAKEKDTIEVGLWVEDIYNIDYVDRTFEAVFWIWINSETEFYELEKYVDYNNAVESSYDMLYKEKLDDGRFHTECKVRAKFLNRFKVNSFPYDHQVIHINMEFIKETANLCFVKLSPKRLCNFSPENIEDFEEKKFKTIQSLYREDYQTNFGNYNLGKAASYHRLEIDIHLDRHAHTIALKLFITLLIAFLLASSSILLPLNMSEEKFALIVGSLFTAIGNKYITDGMLPFSGNFNLSDSLHMLTFIFISIMSFYAVVEQRYRIDRSKKMDLLIFFGVQIVFICSVIIVINQYRC